MNEDKPDRQQRYIQKLRDEGKCIRCRKKAMPEKSLCEKCTKKARIYMRNRLGYKKWTKGNRGRPPRYQ